MWKNFIIASNGSPSALQYYQAVNFVCHPLLFHYLQPLCHLEMETVYRNLLIVSQNVQYTYGQVKLPMSVNFRLKNQRKMFNINCAKLTSDELSVCTFGLMIH